MANKFRRIDKISNVTLDFFELHFLSSTSLTLRTIAFNVKNFSIKFSSGADIRSARIVT